jgi:hypothetical protein
MNNFFEDDLSLKDAESLPNFFELSEFDDYKQLVREEELLAAGRIAQTEMVDEASDEDLDATYWVDEVLEEEEDED